MACRKSSTPHSSIQRAPSGTRATAKASCSIPKLLPWPPAQAPSCGCVRTTTNTLGQHSYNNQGQLPHTSALALASHPDSLVRAAHAVQLISTAAAHASQPKAHGDQNGSCCALVPLLQWGYHQKLKQCQNMEDLNVQP
eukprot:scaffold68321_cov20-Tisochrysis_lutea.AAC.2